VSQLRSEHRFSKGYFLRFEKNFTLVLPTITQPKEVMFDTHENPSSDRKPDSEPDVPHDCILTLIKLWFVMPATIKKG
jgi:hypothetical protein